MTLRMVLPRYALTGIGSLPHTDPEAALAMAFAVDIPYLPQLEDERMVSSALTGSRAWVPFLREVERRRAPFAKIQIAGPAAVAEWGPTAAAPSLLAERALEMVQALRKVGAVPLLYLDEPGLRDMDVHPALVKSLQREGALVGLHSCSDIDWGRALSGLGLDVISFDAQLSLESLLADVKVLERYLDGGGRLSFGVISSDGASYPAAALEARIRSVLGERRATQALQRCLLTPACGLALKTVPESEAVFERLRAWATACQA